MPAKVKLDEIVEAMGMSSDTLEHVYDRETGRIEMIFEDDVLDEDSPEGEEAAALLEAYENDESGRFVPLPDKHEIDEYSLMESFALSLCGSDGDSASGGGDGRPRVGVGDVLLTAIRGSGAFRRFKDAAHEFGVIKQWYAYRDEGYREVAIRWCRDNEIDAEGLPEESRA